MSEIKKEDLIDIMTGAIGSTMEDEFFKICDDKLKLIKRYCQMNVRMSNEPHLAAILHIIASGQYK